MDGINQIDDPDRTRKSEALADTHTHDPLGIHVQVKRTIEEIVNG